MDLNSLFQEELEALQAIYMDDLMINESSRSQMELKITLHPSTADQMELKNVCLTLIFCIDSLYPNKEAKILLRNPRGLSDAHFASIEENLKSLASSKVGEVMLFDLLEYAKESLTDNNHPSCVCPICFEYFQESEQFFRTECYHYFHMPCMKGYIANYSDEKYICPVCRIPMTVDSNLISASKHSHSGQEWGDHMEVSTFMPDEKYKKWREECEVLFRMQKQNGGIIDLEYEKNKYLIKSGNHHPARQTTSVDQNKEQPGEIKSDSSRSTDTPSLKKFNSKEKHHHSVSSKRPYQRSCHQDKKHNTNNKTYLKSNGNSQTNGKVDIDSTKMMSLSEGRKVSSSNSTKKSPSVTPRSESSFKSMTVSTTKMESPSSAKVAPSVNLNKESSSAAKMGSSANTHPRTESSSLAEGTSSGKPKWESSSQYAAQTPSTSCKCDQDSNSKNEAGRKSKPRRKKKQVNYGNEMGSTKENITRNHGDGQSSHYGPSSNSKDKHHRKKTTESKNERQDINCCRTHSKEANVMAASSSSNQEIRQCRDDKAVTIKTSRPPPGFEKHVLNNARKAQVQDALKNVDPPPGF